MQKFCQVERDAGAPPASLLKANFIHISRVICIYAPFSGKVKITALDREGKVVERFEPTADMDSVAKAIEKLL